MTDTNSTPVNADTDDLDAFNDLFNAKAAEDPVVETEDAPSDDTIDANNSEPIDTHPVATEDEPEDTEEDEAPEPQTKKNKKTFQERMDEVTREKYEALRRADALEARLQALEAKPTLEVKAEPKDETSGPTPDDLQEDGTPKYPLGEFDPKFNADLTRFNYQQIRAEEKAQEAAEAQKNEMEQTQTLIQQNWAEKLTAVTEEIPDFLEKGQELESTFSDLEPAYGHYLATAIMTMEEGPKVLYYLSNNLEEAQKIVNLGPTQATIALGRLEARFVKETEDGNNRATIKVSQAPAPPPSATRGMKGNASIPDDTDDLDAFADKFFKKK